MKGYKAFDKNLKCRDFQFKVGKTYTISEKLQMCSSGFHFCQNFYDVYNYYTKDINTRICEIEALGEILTESDKSCTSKIKIIKELSHSEILEMLMKNTNSGNRNSGDWNSGDGNSGYGNSGNRNSGDWNSGYGNSGNRNSGDWNSGYGNSGNRNSGNRNSGDWNSGDGNSGYGNSGNRNSGDWNSGDGNSGYFNTEIPVYFFNKPTTIKYSKDLENKLRSINVKPILQWVTESNMTEQEKIYFPSFKTTGGFLRKTDRMDWKGLTNDDKKLILSLPCYDDDVFEKISGIRLLTPKTVKVLVNGIEKEVSYEDAKKLGLVE